PRLLSPVRSKQPAASAPRPHAQPTRCSQHAASAPRPHTQQAARCLGHSASCAASTLPYYLAASLPRLLSPMRSKQPAASAPRPNAQPTRCSQHAASAPRPHTQQAASLPWPLGLMRSQHAASAPQPHAQRTHLSGHPAHVVLLGPQLYAIPRHT
ncbi:unnamed protein product, partial [Musa hybrid cultivar]